MVSQALNLIANAFGACVTWADSLFDSVQGKGVIIGALLIVFVTSLFLMPLRGGSVNISNAITDYAGNAIFHKGKYAKGHSLGSRRKVGKFERGNTSARLVRQNKLRSK